MEPKDLSITINGQRLEKNGKSWVTINEKHFFQSEVKIYFTKHGTRKKRKILGFYYQKIFFQSEVKSILRSIAQGIKSIYTVRNCVSESFKNTD